MKKKYYLLLLLCLMLMPITSVKGAGVCGYAYISSSAGYGKFYNQGSNGYCGPSKSYIESSRGYSKDKYYNAFDGAKCTISSCKYYYIHSGTENGGSLLYLSMERFPSNQVEGAYGIKLFYDYPHYIGDFTTYSVGTCLKENKTGNYVYAQEGAKYLNTGDRGYLVVDSSNCQNASSSSGGSSSSSSYSYTSCTSSYMQSGCNTEDVKALKSKLKLIGEKNNISSCSSLTVDTNYDSATVTCVKEYQTFKQISSDGITGSQTLTKVNSDYKIISEELAKQAVKDSASKYYAVTFNTDGGHFANGESTRTVYFSTYETVMYPGTPGKTGYKFLGWYNGNDKYSFDVKVSGELTLTAKWETVETSLYCSNDNDVLDVDTAQCITVETFEPNANNTEDKFYIVTPSIYQTITTTSKFKRYCNNNVYALVENYKESEGSNNTVQCGTDLNYVRDLWRAADSCQVGSYCDADSSIQEDCSRVWRGTCYATYDALEDLGRVITDEEELYDDPDEGGKPSQEEIDKNKDNDANSNPETGNALILIAWTIGLGALGYSIYWFKNRSEEL